ncbi:MAG: FAD-binding protein [Chitinivibrionales bacterium]|nr:FAD-binding protein [Chitinivibrionales bacterium]
MSTIATAVSISARDGQTVEVPMADIENLQRRLEGRLLTSVDPEYDQARRVWNGLIDRRPKLIVQCASVNDVVAAVELVRDHGLRVSIRGGGHNVAGHAVCGDGVVIDMSLMRTVRVNPGARRVVAQSGARLADIDTATVPYELAVPLGVVSATGIAGLTLGGGYGWLSRRYGLTSDNLRGAQVVLGSGRVVHASEDENPDLFWALRGGGGGFGVVTEFTYQAHPIDERVWVAMPIYPMDKAAKVLSFVRSYAPKAPAELAVLVSLWMAPDTEAVPRELRGAPAVVPIGMYTGPFERGEKNLRPLRQIASPITDLSSPMRFEQAQRMLDTDYPDGRLYYWKSTYLRELDDSCIETLEACARLRPSALSSVDVWMLGAATGRAPISDTPMTHRSEPWLVAIEANWDDPAQTAANKSWTRETFEKLEQFSSGGSYVNFGGLADEREETAKRAYTHNYPRLHRIRAAYDPMGVFGL